MTRFEYFLDCEEEFDEIVDSYSTPDYDEVVVKNGGDYIRTRIYGDEETGFTMYEK